THAIGKDSGTPRPVRRPRRHGGPGAGPPPGGVERPRGLRPAGRGDPGPRTAALAPGPGRGRVADQHGPGLAGGPAPAAAGRRRDGGGRLVVENVAPAALEVIQVTRLDLVLDVRPRGAPGGPPPAIPA